MFGISSLVYAKPHCDKMGDDGKPSKEMMEKMHQKHLGKLVETLKLTDDQKTKVDQIMKTGWEEMQAKKDKFKQEMKDLRNQKDSQIKEVLSDEQKTKFDSMCKEMKENMDCKKEKGSNWKFWKKCHGKKMDCKDKKKMSENKDMKM
jgi:hypothetical protein